MKAHRRKSVKSEPKRSARTQSEPKVTRRQIWLACVVGGGASLAIFIVFLRLSSPHHLTQQERILIGHYDSIRAALSLDDLSAARTAALFLGNAGPDHERISESATTLARAESLQAARSAFSAMSSEVIKIASGNRGYYRVGCSMANCPSGCAPCDTVKFGEWIQITTVVQNPFMGRTHSDCGIVK